jgi:ubiquinone/menaquinone biosynthesis C-methylase UbiE
VLQSTSVPLAGGGGRVLDVGAGNGGVALGLAFDGTFDVTAVDIIANDVFRRVRRAAAHIGVKQIVGSGHDLPFPANSFDLITCLEVLEHVPDTKKLGHEIMRVLRPGGLCMLMTPARFKWLFKRDPHFGIRGLLLLPDRAQEIVVARWLKRTKEYDVVHTFWTLSGIAGLFPGAATVEPLYDDVYPFAVRSALYNRLWLRFRHLLWDRLVVKKAA